MLDVDGYRKSQHKTPAMFCPAVLFLVEIQKHNVSRTTNLNLTCFVLLKEIFSRNRCHHDLDWCGVLSRYEKICVLYVREKLTNEINTGCCTRIVQDCTWDQFCCSS